MSDTNFKSAKQFVEMKRTHNQESLSGPGSWVKNAQDTISFINESVNKYNIKSILDLGCGDWNWFKEVDIPNCSYTGWDADEQMIASNNDRYGSDTIKFEVKDIFNSKYPTVDLVICRDVLFHVREELTLKLIDQVKSSSTYFISTSFRDVTQNKGIKKYCDIGDWGFYPINLNVDPFNLNKYEISHIRENNLENNRSLCIFKLK